MITKGKFHIFPYLNDKDYLTHTFNDCIYYHFYTHDKNFSYIINIKMNSKFSFKLYNTDSEPIIVHIYIDDKLSNIVNIKSFNNYIITYEQKTESIKHTVKFYKQNKLECEYNIYACSNIISKL